MIVNVKPILKEKGIKQLELAEKLGMDKTSLSRILSGNPTVETLQKIADALGVEVRDLFVSDKNTRTIFLKEGEEVIIKSI